MLNLLNLQTSNPKNTLSQTQASSCPEILPATVVVEKMAFTPARILSRSAGGYIRAVFRFWSLDARAFGLNASG